jgi:hypothetical protein
MATKKKFEAMNRLDRMGEDVTAVARTIQPVHPPLPVHKLAHRTENARRTSFRDFYRNSLAFRGNIPDRRFAAALLLLTVFLGVFAGTASASLSALPGEVLYPIRSGIGALPVALEASPTETANIEMNQYQRRLQDLENLAVTGKISALPMALEQFEIAAKHLSIYLQQLEEQKDPATIQAALSYEAALEPHFIALENLIEIAPSSATPALERALMVSAQQKAQIQNIIQ